MARVDRRRFLKLAGGAATAGLVPASIRKALAIPAHHKTGTLMDVEHVVILIQENRSFDHYFGTLPGVRGFGDRITIPLPDGRSVWEQRYVSGEATRIIMPYHLDSTQGNAQRVSGTPHGWDNAIPAWHNGRIDDWPTYKEPQSMGYYREAELEYQFALANAFTLCDAYHCAFHGGTNTNRLFYWSGTNDPAAAGGGPAISNAYDSLGPSSEGYTWTTYPERLQQAGVSWKLYQNLPDNFTDNPLAGFRQYRSANEAAGNDSDGSPYPAYRDADDAGNPLYKGVANTMPRGNIANPDMLRDFAADIAAGQLPQVSWVVAPASYSEHPGPSSPVQGGWYIQEVLNALTEHPEVFSKTVLLIGFDENDGFFDHVPPHAAPSKNADGSLAGKSTVADLDSEYYSGETFHDHVFGPGPRVPFYVVSPWSRGGWVCSQAFDHTSVIRFLEQRFGVAEPNISDWRRAFSGDLMSCFNFVSPNDDAIESLPTRSKAAADLIRIGQEFRSQVAVPDESVQQPPGQPAGVKASRALPYELHATAQLDARQRQLRLLFGNTGAAGAVFHVYDRLHLDRDPRRYGVEAGRLLDDVWNLDGDDGHYDLWVLGPNGWHRHFTGDPAAQGRAEPELRVCYALPDGDLLLQMSNGGTQPCTLVVADRAYGLGGPWQFVLGAGESTEYRWSLAATQRWYDFQVTLQDDASGYSRRFAGRIENGVASISDPAMGA